MPEEQAARPPPPSREHEERLEVFRAYAQEHFLERDCRAGSGVRLKVDAQVMLLWNLDFGAKLANGSRGVVKGFVPAMGYFYLITERLTKSANDDDGSDGGSDRSGDDAPCDEPKKLTNDKCVKSQGGLAVITPHKLLKEEDKNERFDFFRG